MTRSKWIFAVAALALIVSTVQASPTLQVTTQVWRSYNPTTGATIATATGTSNLDTTTAIGSPRGFKIKFFFTISGQASDQSFAYMTWDLARAALPTGLSRDPARGWSENNPTMTWVDPDTEATVNKPTYSVDSDTNAIDFKAFLVQTDPLLFLPDGVTDPRQTLGEGGVKAYVGFVNVIWDGVHSAALTLSAGLGSGTEWALLNDTTHQWTVGLPAGSMTMVGNGITGAPSNAVQFGEIPEPATMTLLAIGGLLAIRRKR